MSWFAGKKKILNFVLPLLLALIFFSLSTQTARRATWYESALLNILAPFETVVTSVSHFMGSIWSGYIGLVGAQKENRALKDDNARLQGTVLSTEEIKQENERLRELLNYKGSVPYQSVVARVIANDPRSEFKSITIDKGYKDGIDVFMPVIGPKGLVGRIGLVSAGHAQVLLISDPNSSVDVLIQRSRARGLLVGTSRRTELRAGSTFLSRIEYLRRVSDVVEGDVVVTSGFDQVYPPGIPVGTLNNVISSRYGVFQEADVVPFEEFPSIQEVLVLLKQVDRSAGEGS